LLFDIEISVRIVLSAPVEPGFFPRPNQPTARISLEDVDFGVSDWRQLEGKDIAFPDDQDMDPGAIYLASIHNPVRLQRVRFGVASQTSIRAEIELDFDFRCVNPLPAELEKSFRVLWEIDFEVISEEEES
jgi:hypothetical protein